jgi:RimJ/RimL family protein N-acetyltransferase
MAGLTGTVPIPTPRLHFARLTQADAKRLQVLTDDPTITGAISFLPTPFSLIDAKRLIEQMGDQNTFLAVMPRANSELVGIVGAHLQDAGTVEIGYWIGRAWQGRGYGAEAAAALIAKLRIQFPKCRIVAECRRENIASWKTLEKVGFRATGEKGKREGRELLAL